MSVAICELQNAKQRMVEEAYGLLIVVEEILKHQEVRIEKLEKLNAEMTEIDNAIEILTSPRADALTVSSV